MNALIEGNHRLNSYSEILTPQLQLVSDTEFTNETGSFQLIKLGTENIEFAFPSRELLFNNLNLIYGIG